MRTFLIMLFLFPAILSAQEETLPGGELEVIKNFDARLAEAEKVEIPLNYFIGDTATELLFDYDVSVYDIPITYPEPVIRPLAMGIPQKEAHYAGHIRGGYGYPGFILADASYYHRSKEDLLLYAMADYLRAKDPDIEHKEFSDLGLTVGSNFIFDNRIYFTVEGSYETEHRFLYGYDHSDPDLNFTDENSDRLYRTFKIGTNLSKGNIDQDDFGYHTGLQYYNHADRLYATVENGLYMTAGGWLKWDRHRLGVDLIMDISVLDDTLERNQNNYFLLPEYSYTGEKWSIHLISGLGSSKDEFYFLPDAIFTYDLLGNNLQVYGGIKSKMNKNSFLALTDYNPYVNNRLDTLANTHSSEYFAGIRGNYKNINYQTAVGFQDLNSLAVYNRVPEERLFKVDYIDASAFFLRGNASYSLSDRSEASLSFEKRFYDSDPKLWHVPSLFVTGGVNHFFFEEKLSVLMSVVIRGGFPVLDRETFEEDDIGTVFELNLEGSYYFTDKIGLFIQANNLLNDETPRWEGYDRFGISILGGIKARFHRL